jgi:two-component system sensor histidine kinase SenX3
VDIAVAVPVALLAGLAVGVAVTFVALAGRHRPDRRPNDGPDEQRNEQRSGSRDKHGPKRTELPPRPVPAAAEELSRRVLEVMRSGALVLDSADEVVLANPVARGMGVVRGGRLMVDEMRRLARAARRSGEPLQSVVDTPRGRLGREPVAVSVQVAPLAETGYVALLLEDVTEARRLEAVRRDFVANVSHELKTPVGALTLLAEAIQDAAGEPAAVRRFAGRMQHEGLRLGRLVQELIELSRLQGADPLPTLAILDVDRIVAEALDRTRLAAESAGISVVSGGDTKLTVRGSEAQLVTALANLVDNAVAYSPVGTRVAVGTRRREGSVEISVSDQGIGIAERDLERVFERFYRADPARSRATGGTGLGLAIVKHIASNHGGGVSVWSVEGSGSTFTLRLPVAAPLFGAGAAGLADSGTDPDPDPDPDPDIDPDTEDSDTDTESVVESGRATDPDAATAGGSPAAGPSAAHPGRSSAPAPVRGTA